jgi:hypothetical protein
MNTEPGVVGECGAYLTGAARCRQPTFGRRVCSYHDRVRQGLISIVEETLTQARSQLGRPAPEGDRWKSPVYEKALRRSPRARTPADSPVELRDNELEDIRHLANRRDHRRALEAMLLLAGCGDVAGWRDPEPKPKQPRTQRPPRPVRVRTWHAPDLQHATA